MIVLVFIYRVLVTKKACEKTSPRGARDGTKKFGLLKAALGAILNFYADHKVRLRPLAQISFDKYISRNLSLRRTRLETCSGV